MATDHSVEITEAELAIVELCSRAHGKSHVPGCPGAHVPKLIAALRSARERLELSFTALRLLDKALGAMNEAVSMTTEQGPAVAIEYIADYLNDTDAVDRDLAENVPDDWLSRWKVVRDQPEEVQNA